MRRSTPSPTPARGRTIPASARGTLCQRGPLGPHDHRERVPHWAIDKCGIDEFLRIQQSPDGRNAFPCHRGGETKVHMESLMRFGKHVFISFAHMDNQSASASPGWVTHFHASLDRILSTRLGRKAEIWRDEKLRGNDVFADEIVNQLPDAAVLVSVVSPRYVR